jgi:transcriptional regulator with XRE-family HTH domain
MSTGLTCNLNGTQVKHCAIRTDVRADRDRLADLAEFVRREMKKGDRDWSNHEVARRAKAGGYTLSNGTVWSILNKRYKNVKDETLEALAYVFGVPKAEIVSIYLGPPTDAEHLIRNERLAALAADAEKLSPEDVPKFEALMDYVHTTVRQMIKERGRESSRKPRRSSKVIYGDGALPEVEKKRA